MTDQVLCGWRVRSEIPLPELVDWRGDDRPPDVVIRVTDPVPPVVDAERVAPRLTVDADGVARLEVEDVATFHVRDGREVGVSGLRLARGDQALRLHLLGSVLVLLCHQRGLLPLHGSCIRWDSRGAVAVLGVSGAGKSTLAAALRRTGRMVLADDVCVIEMRRGAPWVRPAFPRLKLWRGALPIAGLAEDPGVADGEAQGKHHFRFTGTGEFDPEPLPLRAIYLLATASAGGPAAVETLGSAPERMAELRTHLRRRGVVLSAARRAALIHQLFQVSMVTPVRRLVRCAEPDRIEETLAALRASLELPCGAAA